MASYTPPFHPLPHSANPSPKPDSNRKLRRGRSLRFETTECQRFDLTSAPASVERVFTEWGGIPRWFLACPCGCGRRAYYVWQLPDGTLRVRKCARIVYPSERRNKTERTKFVQARQDYHNAAIRRELVALGLVKAAMSTDELRRTLALYHAVNAIAQRATAAEFRQRNRKPRTIKPKDVTKDTTP